MDGMGFVCPKLEIQILWPGDWQIRKSIPREKFGVLRIDTKNDGLERQVSYF